MQNCNQTETQSVYQHGISVKEHIFDLILYLETGKISDGWRLPSWIIEYKSQLLLNILPLDIIEEYTIFHDAGKPYCLFIDESGKKHFPNHAEVSYYKYLEVGGSKEVANLIRMDMMIHTMKAADIEEFIKHPEAITLLLVGLSEVHSNSKLFGGIESDSFKIKWKQINKRGQAICSKFFGDEMSNL